MDLAAASPSWPHAGLGRGHRRALSSSRAPGSGCPQPQHSVSVDEAAQGPRACWMCWWGVGGTRQALPVPIRALHARSRSGHEKQCASGNAAGQPRPAREFPNAPAQFVLCTTSLSKVSKFGHEDAPTHHKLGRVFGKQWVSQGSENQCDQVRGFPEPVREGRGPRGAEALLDGGLGRRRRLSPCSVPWHAPHGFGGQRWSGAQRTGGRPTGENCLPCYGSISRCWPPIGDQPHVRLRGGDRGRMGRRGSPVVSPGRLIQK